jgi:pimeloyl-ACP methyl ester carboxylesterase
MHGGWCWTEVVRHLAAAGHQAKAPDLPGMGTDRTPPRDITLKMTGGFIAKLARSQPEKIILVGHSLGGIAITEAAEQVPEAIAGLIYVSAVLLPSGAAAMSTLKHTGRLPPGVSLSADSATLFVDPKYARERYYNGCAEPDVEHALAHLVPQPTRPMLDSVFHTPERFGAIPRAYVECLNDNALTLDMQRLQRAALPCSPVFAMQTGHSPFLQAPKVLSEHLITAATAFAAASHDRLPP